MYDYIYNKDDRNWTVGYFTNHDRLTDSREWRAIRDCETEQEAYAFINYLNGGKGHPFPGGAD